MTTTRAIEVTAVRRVLTAVTLAAAVTAGTSACDPTGSGVTYYSVCPAGQHAEPVPGVPGQRQCVKGEP